MAEVVERQKEADEPPVGDSGGDVQRQKQHDLEDAPSRETAALARNRTVNRFRVIAEKRKEDVCPQPLGHAVVPMFVNRERIASASAIVRKIGVSFVMILVDLLVKNL